MSRARGPRHPHMRDYRAIWTDAPRGRPYSFAQESGNIPENFGITMELREAQRTSYRFIPPAWQRAMRQPPMRQPACSQRCVIVGWLAAIIACSGLYVAATGAAGAPAEDCVQTQSHLGVWETVFLLALLAPPAGIACAASRGGAWSKKCLTDMAPSLFMVFLACAFAVVYAGGWSGVCDVSTLSSIAVLASYGVVLSVAMLAVYRDLYGTSAKERFQDPFVLVSVMTTTVFAHNMLQGMNWMPQDVGATMQFFAAIAMMASAVATAIFDAEYHKNRRHNLKLVRILPPIFLITIGVLAYYVTSGVDEWRVGDGDDIQLYVVQTMWAGVTIAVGMLVAHATEFPTKSPFLWLVPAIMLAVLAPLYHGISSEWECLTSMAKCTDPPGPIVSMYKAAGHLDEGVTLRPWFFVTALLVIWHIFTALAVAILGAALAARVRAKHKS